MPFKNFATVFICTLISSALIFAIIRGSLKKPRKIITLSANNVVINHIRNTYYDTTLSLALDELGILGVKVHILPLSENTKAKFDGELKAHLRYRDNQFYLYTDFLNESESIEVLSHEAIHVQQYLSKDFVYQESTATAYWKGKEVDLDKISYEKRPWEIEAFKKQWSLSEKVYNNFY